MPQQPSSPHWFARDIGSDAATLFTQEPEEINGHYFSPGGGVAVFTPAILKELFGLTIEEGRCIPVQIAIKPAFPPAWMRRSFSQASLYQFASN